MERKAIDPIEEWKRRLRRQEIHERFGPIEPLPKTRGPTTVGSRRLLRKIGVDLPAAIKIAKAAKRHLDGLLVPRPEVPGGQGHGRPSSGSRKAP